MAQFEPYLYFDGHCAEALKFYEQVLGAKTEMSMTYAEAPPMEGQPPMVAGSPAGDRIMHASVLLDGDRIMASDMPPGMPFDGMKGFSISLAYGDVAEGRKVFDALAEGGQVRMPFGKVFWAEGFGMLVDRFGTPWMVNAGPDVSA